MRSKWFELKPKAIELRQKGTSLREVERNLNIPRSTLSGWFKNVKLNRKQKLKLKQNQINHLVKAREKAILWHNGQREKRLKEAENQAVTILSGINTEDDHILQLALSMLYLGEGSKTKSGTCIGSSDPLILKFFIKTLISHYEIDICKIKCALHLRFDQNPERLKRYWSKKLNIPLGNFTSPSMDGRTVKSPTYSTYNGVCVVSCGNIALQRQLLHLSRKFCEKIVDSGG